MKVIPHPNSCGQGYCADYIDHPLNKTIINNGYVYSHSIGVHLDAPHGDKKVIYHCYKHPFNTDYVVSIADPEADTIIIKSKYNWDAHKLGSGYHKTGFGEQSLNKYLINRKKRFKLK